MSNIPFILFYFAESAMDMLENTTKNRRIFLQNLKRNFTDDGKIVKRVWEPTFASYVQGVPTSFR